MKKSFTQKITDGLRKITPLPVRIKIGPIIAYIAYIFRMCVQKNKNVPHVLSIEETIDLIGKKKLSVIRFGDGEISLIDNIDLAFQKYNKHLASRLKFILQTNKNGLLICIPGMWGEMRNFNKETFLFLIHHLFKHGHVWNSLLSHNQIYGDTFITRPYLLFKDTSHSGIVFKKIMSLWGGEDVILIEGEKSRLGVGNDLFSNVKSLQRILCPAENAFLRYDKIKQETLKINRDKLILISLGPTAKILAYDLFLAGYHVLDIGHIDMEYEMFLRKENKRVKVKYKYSNEINERNPEDYKDPIYLDQIIAHIK
jgi:glycosyltransferase family protein